MDLTKHLILQLWPWKMMEHRERHGRCKYRFGKGQLRRIALNDAHTGGPEALAQTRGETEIEFNRGQAPGPALQQIRREAGARSQLKQIFTQRNAFEYPWH